MWLVWIEEEDVDDCEDGGKEEEEGERGARIEAEQDLAATCNHTRRDLLRHGQTLNPITKCQNHPKSPNSSKLVATCCPWLNVELQPRRTCFGHAHDFMGPGSSKEIQ